MVARLRREFLCPKPSDTVVASLKVTEKLRDSSSRKSKVKESRNILLKNFNLLNQKVDIDGNLNLLEEVSLSKSKILSIRN